MLAIAVAACADTPAHETPQSSDGGAGGDGGASATTADATSAPAAAHLVLPDVVDLPYVVAGEGGTSVTFGVSNDGGEPLVGPDGAKLAWSIAGDPSITLTSAPDALAPGATESVTVAFAGADAETIAHATLSVSTEQGAAAVPLWAVAGDPGLGNATFEPIAGAGGVPIGDGVTVGMPAAPFPDGNAPWSDDSVHVFVPEGYRDRGAQDVVVHFHGWSTTIDDTLSGHHYREHVYASGDDAVLVVPQGPVDAQSGDFGKLMQPGGLSRLVDEVLVFLYREGRIAAPTLGKLVLTSHSGGYQAVDYELGAAAQAPPLAQIDLFDSMYGYVPDFVAYAENGGLLRSDYTENGGTKDDNLSAIAALKQDGTSVATDFGELALMGDAPVVFYSPTSHDGSTRWQGAYGEELRWALGHSRRGPRIELRSVVPSGNGQATIAWRSPPDEDLTGFRVETSADGASWALAIETGKSSDHATIPLDAGVRVRVVPETSGVDPKDALASDQYRVDPAASTLVVDGFDRVIDGSYGGLSHDFAARVGEALGGVATASHHALAEGGVSLAGFSTIVWLLGDQSTADVTLSADERALLSDFVANGGSLVVSGSELAYDLAGSADGLAFLDTTFGAGFASDDAKSLVVTGQGPLAALGTFGYSGPNAPYQEDYPDALTPADGGAAVLTYETGQAAAVGIPGKAVLVGFPLELVDEPAKRSALVKALVAFAGG